MADLASPSPQTSTPPPSGRKMLFEIEAAEVLESLRRSISGLLSDIGGITKPVDIQKGLSIDQTLSFQLFKIATSANALSCGSTVPSRTALKRVLEAAKSRTTPERSAQILSAHEDFERLVDKHAGDRVTFNSMISPVCGIDHEWHVVDLHHRRNMFRGFSHATGYQIKTSLGSIIFHQDESTGTLDMLTLVGFIGLKVLRPLEKIKLFSISKDAAASGKTRLPLHMGTGANGYLLDQFSSKPGSPLTLTESVSCEELCTEVSMQWPEVGNVGTSNFIFGELTTGITDTGPSGVPQIGMGINRAIELLMLDLLVPAALLGNPNGNPQPTVLAQLLNLGPHYKEPGIPLEGNFKIERLGKGPAALSTPEIPHYQDMLQAAAISGAVQGKSPSRWPIEEYEAVRLRIEYPMHQCFFAIPWQRTTTPSPSE